jgi:hypothetical protein
MNGLPTAKHYVVVGSIGDTAIHHYSDILGIYANRQNAQNQAKTMAGWNLPYGYLAVETWSGRDMIEREKIIP